MAVSYTHLDVYKRQDLDFGIYRIMHAKAGEVTQFLELSLRHI